MLETNNPDIDIDKLLEQVEIELKIQKKSDLDKNTDLPQQKLEINDPYSWNQLSETLKIAEQNVNAGADVTSMLHYRGFIRKIARLLGKVVIFLGRVITIPQRNFNSAILHSLRISLDGIRDMNRNTALVQRQVHNLEKKLQENNEQLKDKLAIINYLKDGLTSQERRVEILLQEVRRQASGNTEKSQSPAPSIETPDILDPLYLAFENQFRGSQAEIRERLLEYVPLMKKCDAGSDGREILDIGCCEVRVNSSGVGKIFC